MATNEILPFGTAGTVDDGDVLALADYGTDWRRTRGHQAGVASRALQNTVLRQVSHMAAGVAQFISNRYTSGVVDDGDLDKVEAGLAAAVLAIVSAHSVPAGTVSAFSGTFGGTGNKYPIPVGSITPDTSWALCDGSNGTPDLRGRFILGASTTYTAGSTGGAAAVTPTITVSSGGEGTSGSAGGDNTGATTLSINQIPSHNHTIEVGLTECWESSRNVFGPGGGYGLATSYAGGGQSHTHTVAAHTHYVHGHVHGATCTQISLLPPYYAMAFIMKLAA